jgi:transposase-like protein
MTRTLGAPPLRMTIEQRNELESMVHSFSSPYRAVVQAKALLLAADGAANHEIARRLGVASNSVRTWRRRFQECGTSWVGTIAPVEGRRPSSPAATVVGSAQVAGEAVSGDRAVNWPTRSLGNRLGTGRDTVVRIWRGHACESGSS